MTATGWAGLGSGPGVAGRLEAAAGEGEVKRVVAGLGAQLVVGAPAVEHDHGARLRRAGRGWRRSSRWRSGGARCGAPDRPRCWRVSTSRRVRPGRSWVRPVSQECRPLYGEGRGGDRQDPGCYEHGCQHALMAGSCVAQHCAAAWGAVG
jgi:hypothetical protein